MLVLAGIVLTLAVATLVFSPLVRHVAAPLTDGPDVLAQLRELQALKGVTYETLQDIELDYHAGKIRLVQRIEEIEAQVPRQRGRRPGGT